jgi:hypothetical protein
MPKRFPVKIDENILKKICISEHASMGFGLDDFSIRRSKIKKRNNEKSKKGALFVAVPLRISSPLNGHLFI